MDDGGDKKLRRNHGIVGAVKMLARAPGVAANADEFDQNPDLAGTPDGILDLRTGNMLDGTREELGKWMITKCLACAPADEESSMWKRCLEDWTMGDEDLERQMQLYAGYCLTGYVTEQAFSFLYGTGANGKSVFVDLMLEVAGGYGRAVSMDVFINKRYEQHPAELAQLMGVRLAVAAETKRGRKWDDGRVKNLTGGDKINARFMRQNPFDFMPTHKLLLHGNYQPRLDDVGESMRRRLAIVPFKFKPSAEQLNPNLLDELKAELPGVLRWMVNGAVMWYESGLLQSEVSKAETEEYFAEQDVLGGWMAMCCEEGPQYSEPNPNLWESFELYQKREGESSKAGGMNRKAFNDEMRRRGFLTKVRSVAGKKARHRLEIRLNEEARRELERERERLR